MAEAHFSEEYLETEVGEYRPMSKLALLAAFSLIPGIAAPLAPFLIAFDIIAIVLATISLIAIRARTVGGHKLAVGTIMVALFVISFLATSVVHRNMTLTGVAVDHAEYWVGLLEDEKLYEAHQLSLYYTDRRPPEVSLEEHYRVQDTSIELGSELFASNPYFMLGQYFTDRPPVRWLKNNVQKLDIECRGVVAHEVMDGSAQRFTVEFATSAEEHPVFHIIMQRNVDFGEGETHWYVYEVRFP